jgi:carbamoyltransferase
MIALGLNGWIDKTHDAAAALVIDGKLVAFVEQERISRKKHAVGEVPHAAVAAVLSWANVEPHDVDLIAYGWDLGLFNAVRGRRLSLNPDDAVMALCGFRPSPRQKVHWVDHHKAHAASAYYSSGFDTASVLVVDAEGETGSTSIYAASDAGLRRVVHFDRSTSLGILFRAASVYCGFGQFGAGQVMGLAPYGRPTPELALRWHDGHIVSPLRAETEEDRLVAAWLGWLESRFGPPAPQARHAPWQTKRPDAARLVQDTVETMMVALVEHAQAVVDSKNVCLAGGVGLNCVANALVAQHVSQLYIPPTPHDAGVALGAAFVVAAENGDCIRPLTRADFGPSYEDDAIERALSDSGHSHTFVDDPARAACDLLQRNKIIGWVQGRMEAGPRALGQRSILARPGDRRLRDMVNDVKDRQRWRPLAPSVRSEDAARLFETGTDSSPFMLLSFRMRPEAAAELPAVAHVDDSARLHTVTADGSHFRRLLDYVAEETGSGVVLNTSFNDAGEPIVCSPRDAIGSFERTGLDALVIGSFLVLPGGRSR